MAELCTDSPKATTTALSSPAAARLSQIRAQLDASSRSAAGRSGFSQSSDETFANSGSPEHAPDLILIFAWTASSRTALAYFTSKYAQLYPSAKVVTFPATISEFMPWPLTTSAFRHRGFDEVLQEVSACLQKDAPPRILVHAFSNGGAVRLATFLALWRSRYSPEAAALPVQAFVFDSCLSRASILEMSGAVRDHIFLLGWWGWLRALLWVPFLVGTWASVAWMRANGERGSDGTWEKWAWRALNDGALANKEVPRLYVYGSRDVVVPPRECEEHAKEAREAGYEVRVERFEGAVHTGSARTEPERYWRCVSEVWERGVGGE